MPSVAPIPGPKSGGKGAGSNWPFLLLFAARLSRLSASTVPLIGIYFAASSSRPTARLFFYPFLRVCLVPCLPSSSNTFVPVFGRGGAKIAALLVLAPAKQLMPTLPPLPPCCGRHPKIEGIVLRLHWSPPRLLGASNLRVAHSQQIKPRTIHSRPDQPIAVLSDAPALHLAIAMMGVGLTARRTDRPSFRCAHSAIDKPPPPNLTGGIQAPLLSSPPKRPIMSSSSAAPLSSSAP